MKNILRNKLTTAVGVVLAAISVAASFNYITPEQAKTSFGLAVALGFALAKDGNQTGIAE